MLRLNFQAAIQVGQRLLMLLQFAKKNGAPEGEIPHSRSELQRLPVALERLERTAGGKVTLSPFIKLCRCSRGRLGGAFWTARLLGGRPSFVTILYAR